MGQPEQTVALKTIQFLRHHNVSYEILSEWFELYIFQLGIQFLYDLWAFCDSQYSRWLTFLEKQSDIKMQHDSYVVAQHYY